MKGLKETILERKFHESGWTYEELLEDMEEYFSTIFYTKGLKGEAHVYWPKGHEGNYENEYQTNESVLRAMFDKIQEVLKNRKQ